VQRLRIRYAKAGPLRFTSHRDVARVLERALRRAGVPMAFSAGFSPHPKISYAGAAPTGVASDAEYLEIALSQRCEPAAIAAALDAALPPGIDIVTVVEATDPKAGLAARLEASRWRLELEDVDAGALAAAVDRLLRLPEAPVERATKDGRRVIDVRAALIAVAVDTPTGPSGGDAPCATIHMVVRHTIPAVRPDDVVVALREHAGLSTPVPPRVTRLAQGQLPTQSPPTAGTTELDARTLELLDPLAADVAARG
jgi:radical SAM-linked protein